MYIAPSQYDALTRYLALTSIFRKRSEERYPAGAVAGQAHVRLAPEQQSALKGPAGIHIEPVLKLEERLDPATKVFGPLHAPSATVRKSAGHRDLTVPPTLVV
ncbi:hypothetical protein RSPO_c00808 [Ralstonia solanacearum Po82]|uniref:Uncharacterized protein n=1 Tax=Ralstonia solanacearum (strain Po82) TaxID=1031711 RepID=F6FYM7_RALS8|nr:hypothetical protein RSPO_c00808 [Ralstonia solanacearum Po82]